MGVTGLAAAVVRGAKAMAEVVEKEVMDWEATAREEVG